MSTPDATGSQLTDAVYDEAIEIVMRNVASLPLPFDMPQLFDACRDECRGDLRLTRACGAVIMSVISQPGFPFTEASQ